MIRDFPPSTLRVKIQLEAIGSVLTLWASEMAAAGRWRSHAALRGWLVGPATTDFEFSASANSATPARRSLKLRNQKLSSSASDLLNSDAYREIRPPSTCHRRDSNSIA